MDISGRAGIGLRSKHYSALLETQPDIGWLEVHAENFFCGGYHRKALREVRQLYPVSIHAVGLSLGSTLPVDKHHLEQLAQLVEEIAPIFVSDHASWSRSGNAHLNDLLPLPYHEESLQALCNNIERVQDRLKRSILIENPTTYLQFTLSTMSEQEFLNEAVRRTGCGLLLDVNNVYVQSYNHGFKAEEYLQQLPLEAVKEMHLAGHVFRQAGQRELCVDMHNCPVKAEVWELYGQAVRRFGAVPTLVEWDADLPTLETLVSEAKKAEKILQATCRKTGKHAAG